MGAVGQSIVTADGINALMDASAIGKLIKPKYFKFSETDYTIDPNLKDINGWIEQDITLYNPIDNNTIEFVCDVAPENATKYAKTAGLYLEDGTLFMIAKPPFPFPPMLRQTFKIQLVYQNAESLIDFKYLPFYETEQSLAILDTSMTFAAETFEINEKIRLLEEAKKDYYKTKGVVNEKIQILEKNSSDIEELFYMQLDNTMSNALLHFENANAISLLKNKKGAKI
jgi:hypothetical protein